MTNFRKFSLELIDNGEQLRYQLLWLIKDFNISTSKTLLTRENPMMKLLNSLIDETVDTPDSIFFTNYQYLTETVFHLIKWGAGTLNAQPGSEAELAAAKLKIELFDLENYNYTEQFKGQIAEYKNHILALEKVGEIRPNFDKLSVISWPYLLNIEQDEFGFRNRIHRQSTNDEPDVNQVLVISLELFIDKEPWANPQILKPQLLYTVHGTLKLNKWPENALKLVIQPFSTQQSSLYELLIPEITKEEKTEFDLSGQVLFKYPQHSFEESYTIKLLAYFLDNNNQRVYPELIGYRQLIAKVLDPNSYFFLTGFPIMNELVHSISDQLQKELPSVNAEDRNNFLKLLSGVLNYQGYCLQAGIYKGTDKIMEDVFRDNMLQYLNAISYLGAEVIKEPQLAGGRIEIYYRGLIVELKVEKSISERDQLIKKYGKQPVAYSSGNSKQLSILVVLDLTEKKLPPAAPQNNVMLVTPELHGFQNSTPLFPSKQVVVIFDGNTKKPSDYSR